MNKNYIALGLGIGVLALSAVSVALASTGNYSAWKTSMGGRGNSSVVTEKNFDQYTQMHQLMADGKYDEAQKVRTTLGMGQGRGQQGGGCGMKQAGGCGVQNGGKQKANFVDTNKNGICDHAEGLVK